MQSELEENSQIAKRCKDREGREAEREREKKKVNGKILQIKRNKRQTK